MPILLHSLRHATHLQPKHVHFSWKIRIIVRAVDDDDDDYDGGDVMNLEGENV